MKTFILLLGIIAPAFAYTDSQCSSYDHETYGCVGECISTGDCPGSKYQSNLCPTQPANVKCCFTADSDADCANYDHPTYGQVGSCIESSQCPHSNYISNLCPTKANSIKCCFSKPEGTCGGGGGGSAQEMACQILANNNIYLLENNGYLNSNGANDGADAESNIRDTCNGGTAKRSSYCCSSGCAPGGSVSLKASVLSYILDVANSGQYNSYLQINAIAGACHSSTSWHYQGTSVDLQIKSGDSGYASSWMSTCSAAGARENLGPGYPGHSTHTHCAFAS
eukprot:XP_003724182.1 PREDICTED: uncharacterized protein LOC100888517 [Strongylocentrotus purpuratus]